MYKDMYDKRTVEVVQSLDSCCDESYTGDEDELTDCELINQNALMHVYHM